MLVSFEALWKVDVLELIDVALEGFKRIYLPNVMVRRSDEFKLKG